MVNQLQGSQVRAETALGTTVGVGEVAPGEEAKEAPSGALNRVNIEVLHQSVSKSFIVVSLSLLTANFNPSSKKRDIFIKKILWFFIPLSADWAGYAFK